MDQIIMYDELLDALAHDHFLRLENHGSHWSILHKSPDGKAEAAICNKTLTSLLDDWCALVSEIEEYKLEASHNA